MSGHAIDINGLHVQWVVIAAVLVLLQWLIFVLISLISREESPDEGLRGSDRRLVVSSAVLAVVWIGLYALRGSAPSSGSTALEASAMTSGGGGCSAIQSGMPSQEVQQKMGKPDEIRSDEDARGPGASILIYRGSRCAVHTLDDRVDFID